MIIQLLCSARLKFSKKKIAVLKNILGMLRTKIERKSAPMVSSLLHTHYSIVSICKAHRVPAQPRNESVFRDVETPPLYVLQPELSFLTLLKV